MKVINRNKNEKDVNIIIISDTEGEDRGKIIEASHNYIIISDSSDEENNYNNDDEEEKEVIFICEKLVKRKTKENYEPLQSPETMSNTKKILTISTTKTNQRISESTCELLNKLKKRPSGDENSNYDVPSMKFQVKKPLNKKEEKIDLESINLDLNSINNVYDLPSLNSKPTLNLKDFIYRNHFQINPIYTISRQNACLNDQLQNLINTNLESGDLLYMNEMFIFLRNLADSNLLNEINLERILKLFKKLESIEEANTNSGLILFFYKNFSNLIQTIISVGFNFELLMKNSNLWKYFLTYLPVLIDKCISQSNSQMFKVYVLKIKIFTDLMFIYVKFVYEIRMDNFLTLNNANEGKKMNWLSFQQIFSINDFESFSIYLIDKFKSIILNKQSKFLLKPQQKSGFQQVLFNTDTLDLLKIIQKLQLYTILFHKTETKVLLEKLCNSYHEIYTNLVQTENIEESKMFFEIILSVDEIKMKLCEKILLNVKFMIYSQKQSNNTNVGIILNSFENLLKTSDCETLKNEFLFILYTYLTSFYNLQENIDNNSLLSQLFNNGSKVSEVNQRMKNLNLIEKLKKVLVQQHQNDEQNEFIFNIKFLIC